MSFFRHSTFCKDHQFCNIQQEFLETPSDLPWINSTAGIPQNPTRVLPSRNQVQKGISLKNVTEQSLDDWFAQSINRSLASMLNPQKKYRLPDGYQQQLRRRYPQLRKQMFVPTFYNQVYFKPAKGHKAIKKKVLDVQDLKFDIRLLQPQLDMPGVPVIVREQRRRQSKLQSKSSLKRKQTKQKRAQNQRTKRVQRNSTLKSSYYINQKQVKPQHYYVNFDDFTRQDIQENCCLRDSKRRLSVQPANLSPGKRKKTLVKEETINRKDESRVERRSSVRLNKKSLEEKIMMLMNQRQLQSFETISFKQLHFQPKILETQVKNARVNQWLILGNQKFNLKNFDLALSCYQQALELDKSLLQACFNIACSYSAKGKYLTAKRWFLLCEQFSSCPASTNLQLGLIEYRVGNFQKSLRYIDKFQQINKKQLEICTYLKALNYKNLKDFSRAKHFYEVVLSKSNPTKYTHLRQLIMGVLMMRIKKIPVDKRINQFKFILQAKQTIEKMFFQQELLDYERLSNFPFFKRFSPSVLQNFSKQSAKKKIQAFQTIIVQPDEVAVLLSGIVQIIDHKVNFLNPKKYGILKAGGLIGANKYDNNLQGNSNLWFYTNSQVDLLIFRKDVFEDFWNAQFTFENDQIYFKLKSNLCFQNFSEVTLLDLCEYCEVREAAKGQIIFQDLSYILRARQQNFYKKEQQGLKKKSFIPGFVIILEGTCQVQNQYGFLMNHAAAAGTILGQTQLIDFRGVSSFGALRVDSQSLKFLLLKSNHFFLINELQRQILLKNCKKRQDIEQLLYSFRRTLQVDSLRKKCRQKTQAVNFH